MLRFLALFTAIARAERPVGPADFDSVEVVPTRPPTKKEAADSGASLDAAQTMPWFPAHDLTCANGTRLCRPGEGNTKGYRFWGQPYIHRESYVQSRRRRPPHAPDPKTSYLGLSTLARRVQKDGMVIMAAADWDFRRVILNFVLHAHARGYTNTLVLSMDTEVHTDMRRRGIPSFDNSDNLDDWNTTCLQRHVQRVRTERVLAIAALIAAGIDVLHCDATVIFVRSLNTSLGLPHLTALGATWQVRDVLPVLRALPPSVDMAAQRHECPPNVQKTTGSGVNPGFMCVTAAKDAGGGHPFLSSLGDTCLPH